MKIAIPMVAGSLSPHFGHCEKFALVDVDTAARTIVAREDHPAPPHEPGALPAWLKTLGADMIIAGGMGQRAQQLFISDGIEVLLGVSGGAPDEVVAAYLDGTLVTGENACDH